MPLKNVPSVYNVAAGESFTIELQKGATYNAIHLDLTGCTGAQLTDLEVKINGKTIQYYQDLDQLDAINDYYGRAYSGNYHILYFIRPEMQEQFRKVTAIGTANVDTFTIVGKIAAAAAAPVLVVSADTTNISQPLNLITKVKHYPVASAGGVMDIDKIPKAGKVIAHHFGKADVTNVIMERDGVVMIDASKTLLEQVEKAAESARVPVTASYTHIDYCLDGILFNAAEVVKYDNGVMVQDYRARVTVTAAGNVDHLVEYLDTFSGL